MPEVMEADMRQSSFLENFTKAVANCVWIERSTIGISKYQVITAKPLPRKEMR